MNYNRHVFLKPFIGSIAMVLVMLIPSLAYAQLPNGVLKRYGWSMGAGTDIAPVSAKPVAQARWYSIQTHQPALTPAVQIFVDGKASNNPVNFGGAALVWGTLVELKRYAGTGTIDGFVSILDPLKIDQIITSWAIFPETNKEVVIGMLDRDREFILTVGEAVKGDCQNFTLKPIVEDRMLVDSAGKDIILTLGGSVIAKGKFIRATMSGTCKAGTGVWGTLTLL